MDWILHYLWLIPALPLLAAAVSALARRRHRKFSAGLAIVAMIGALVLSCIAFSNSLQHRAAQIFNFPWFQFGDPALPGTLLKLGWMLDPLTAVMLAMVSFVGLLIF